MIEIRSYRRVFDLERRIYSVDQLRLNPGGVPVRAVVYFLALVALDLLSGSLPAVGSLAAQLPWYLRDIAVPCAGAAILSAIRLEGRTFHLAAHALLRYRLGPRRVAGGRGCQAPGAVWRPSPLVMLPDGSDGRLRRMRYTGPGAVVVSVEHSRGGRVLERGASGSARWGARRVLTLRESPPARAMPSAQVISLSPGARLLVRVDKRAAR
jgi:hypothetical protein